MQPTNSATFSITTVGGFNVLFTVRENDVKAAKDLLTLVEALDKHFTQAGMKPQVKSSGFTKKEKEWTGDTCPKDGGRLYHITTKSGKDICKCENSKFDFATKKEVGCDFIAWGKNLADAKKKQEEWKRSKQDPTDSWPDNEV